MGTINFLKCIYGASVETDAEKTSFLTPGLLTYHQNHIVIISPRFVKEYHIEPGTTVMVNGVDKTGTDLKELCDLLRDEVFNPAAPAWTPPITE